MIDTTLQIHFASAHQLPERFAVLQQEVHGLKHIHLHGMCRQLLFGGSRSQLIAGLFDGPSQVCQQTLQGAAWLYLWLPYVGQVGAGGPHDSTALGMAEHHDESRSKFPTAEFQTSHHAAFRMGGGVASIADYKKLSWHHVKQGLQWSPRISAAHHCGVWGLSFLHQGFAHGRGGGIGSGFTRNISGVALHQQIQRFLRCWCYVYPCTHAQFASPHSRVAHHHYSGRQGHIGL
mmetsp:Transcript_1966/g.3400  ORF Transcript_1966/g.3400 Transcript_1966/m.3400 type:complete len:233 (+) Transcript_1966:901-1599(+)